VKPRWGFWNNCLVGIPWDRWRALRAENRVDPGYRHRAAMLTLLSIRNAANRRREERCFGAAIARARIEEPLLFVLGHWRTGSTHLHNLLACDAEQFAAPNSIQVTYPFTFLTSEEAVRRQFVAFVPRTRPMDDVALGPDTPQEDEFALCVASLRSPFLGLATFPRRADHYDRYLAFRDVPERELEEWKATLLWFLRKLTLKHGKPLLLKSPTHTARIRLLLDIFPRARFIHIHRDPYAVFQSNEHLLRRLWPIHSLQQPPADPEEQILRRYTRMHDAFFEERPLIPEGQFHEIAFQDLLTDPVGQVRAAYERLGLTAFEAVRPRLQEYVDSLAGYRRNEFGELPSGLRQRVARAWQRSFDAWGYRT
jgi:hypothetical protein